MPAAKIDNKAALNVIAKELSFTTDIPQVTLLQDLKKMDEVLSLQEKFNWEMVGVQLGQTRQQMYRWYHDTHQRKLYGSVSADDVVVIKQVIESAL